jgi:hypothetical protein
MSGAANSADAKPAAGTRRPRGVVESSLAVLLDPVTGDWDACGAEGAAHRLADGRVSPPFARAVWIAMS